MKTRCQYLNQRNYGLDGQLKGAECKSESEVREKVNDSPVYGWCKVHSYAADRFIGARKLD